MKRLFTLLLIVCACMCIPRQMKAVTVTLHFYVPSSWSTSNIKAWIWREGTSGTDLWGDSWDGNKQVCSVETVNGQNIAKWSGEIDDVSNLNVIFKNDEKKTSDLTLSNGAYYNTTGIVAMTAKYEMVVLYGNKEALVLPMSNARYRDQPSTDAHKGQLCSSLYTVGFKDDLLPGKAGDVLQVFLRDKETGKRYGPANGSGLGDPYALANNTNLKDFRNAFYAEGTSNTFTIQKGSGVSYTVGLNTGSILKYSTSATSNPVGYPISYEVKASSITLYTNKSVDDVFRSIYHGSYANGENATSKTDLEDYYLVGDIFGDGYKVPFHTDGVDAEKYKMVKQVFLNPNTNKVDSIVYSKVVRKPSGGSFSNLFLSFAPKSLLQDASRGFGVNDAGTKDLYVPEEKWNLLVRPEVFDEKDATAISGAVLVCGYRNDGNNRCNGQQCLNPIVPESESDLDYYIVRLNVTTSTYRLEFVRKPDVLIPASGIRTFCSQMNLALPDDHYKAYAAHDFEMDEGNKTLNGKSNGKVILRRLNYIPANEAVVLIYDTETPDGFSKKFDVITDADENTQLTDVEEDWWTHKDRYYGQTYSKQPARALALWHDHREWVLRDSEWQVLL